MSDILNKRETSNMLWSLAHLLDAEVSRAEALWVLGDERENTLAIRRQIDTIRNTANHLWEGGELE